MKLVKTLAQFPPPQPTQAAVDLLVTVGQQQEYFSWHNLLPPVGHPGALDALKVPTHIILTRCHRQQPVVASKLGAGLQELDGQPWSGKTDQRGVTGGRSQA